MKFKHPEQRECEVYLGNFRASDYKSVDWQTKRKGLEAYDINGHVLPETGLDYPSPVFVGRSELEAAGIDADNVFGEKIIAR